jgi:hypothetical protein
MKALLACVALSFCCMTVSASAATNCDECRRTAERKAQACESAARVEMQRQICRTSFRDALRRCDSSACRQNAPVADECAQCRKDVQMKAQACQSGARDKAAREACMAAMNEGNAKCQKSYCQKG